MKNTLASLMILLCSLQLSAQTKALQSYPVVISFGSIGTGVPSPEPLSKFIKAYKKDCKLKDIHAVEVGPYGREGEYKIAFLLEGYTETERQCFIDKLTAVAATMKDRGYATVELDVDFSEGNLPPRATIKEKKF